MKQRLKTLGATLNQGLKKQIRQMRELNQLGVPARRRRQRQLTKERKPQRKTVSTVQPTGPKPQPAQEQHGFSQLANKESRVTLSQGDTNCSVLASETEPQVAVPQETQAVSLQFSEPKIRTYPEILQTQEDKQVPENIYDTLDTLTVGTSEQLTETREEAGLDVLETESFGQKEGAAEAAVSSVYKPVIEMLTGPSEGDFARKESWEETRNPGLEEGQKEMHADLFAPVMTAGLVEVVRESVNPDEKQPQGDFEGTYSDGFDNQLQGKGSLPGYRGGSYGSMEQQSVQKSTLQQTEEIDLLDLFGFYMSKLPILIATILIGALISGAFTYYFIPKKYTAVSRMYMISASSDSVVNLADLNLGASLSNDYVELMKSRPVVEEVINSLRLEYSYEQLLEMMSFSVVNNTRIVKISVTSTDPHEAMQIANEMARISKIQLPKVMDAPAPSIAEEAVLPAHKSSPSLSRNTMMGAMLLLFLVLGVLTVIYLMDDTVKTSEDVEKEFGFMPLTVIPEGTIDGLKKEEESRSARRRMRYWRKTKKKKKKKKKSGKE
jgi:capsular polysaccharide biosynthesis protein